MKRLGTLLSRNRRTAVIAGVVLAIAAVIFLTILAGTGDNDLVPATEATTTVPRVTGPNAELLRLVDQGRGGTYSAVYRQVGPAGEGTVRQVRRPPDERVESETGSGDGRTHTVNVVNATGRVVCTRQGEGAWSCESQPGRGSGALTDILSSTIVAQISRVTVEARDDRVGGEAARCFTVSGTQGPPAEVCLTRDGILARVVAGDTRLDLTELSRGAPPDSDFVPPA